MKYILNNNIKNKYLSFKSELISILYAYECTFKKDIYRTYGILLTRRQRTCDVFLNFMK